LPRLVPWRDIRRIRDAIAKTNRMSEANARKCKVLLLDGYARQMCA